MIGGCGIPQGLLNLHRAYGSARSWHGTSAHRQACTTTNNVSRPLLVNRVIDRRSWCTARSFEIFRTLGKRPLLNGISPRRRPRIPSNSPPQSLPGNKLVLQPTESTQQYLSTSQQNTRTPKHKQRRHVPDTDILFPVARLRFSRGNTA